ncbi:hypothetical protein D9M68_704810 [compost metagenome]
MAAPAAAASSADWAISSGVTGRWGDIDGVWTEPVIAQVMMTLFLDFFMGLSGCAARTGFNGFLWPRLSPPGVAHSVAGLRPLSPEQK